MPIIVDAEIVNPPDPTWAESSDGALQVWVDERYGGAKLRALFAVIDLNPHHVRFLRDGLSVRGADPASAVGGTAHGYDHELTLGETVTYQAVAYDDADQVIGTTSQVSIEVPEPKGMFDIWVKSLSNASLSMLLSGRIPEPVIGETARLGLVTAQGSRYPAGAVDRRVAAPIEVTMRLSTVVQRRQFSALIDNGHLFVQFRNAYGEAPFYAVAGDSSVQALTTMTDPRRDVTLSLVPIGRPTTIDSPHMIAGWSIADMVARTPTIATMTAKWPTISEVAGFPLGDMGPIEYEPGGFGTGGFGTGPFGG